MYQRIMNNLDVKNISSAPKLIEERMTELTNILSESYGVDRTPIDMGGYILFFPTNEDVMRSMDSVMEYYDLDSKIMEYQDEYEVDKHKWIEELYILTSDDSLVLIYPKKVVV